MSERLRLLAVLGALVRYWPGPPQDEQPVPPEIDQVVLLEATLRDRPKSQVRRLAGIILSGAIGAAVTIMASNRSWLIHESPFT